MKNIIFIFIYIFSYYSIAKEIKGIVYGLEADNTKKPLIGATVYWMGTKIGALTDKSGKFTIQTTNSSTTLIAIYIGYQRDTIDVKDIEALEIILHPNIILGDVNVEAELPELTYSKTSVNKIEIITESGLKKAACCNLAESFQTNASVDVEYTDAVSGAKQIQLLGLQGIYSQLLTEKVPNFRGLASTFGLNYIPGPWMESIQISKGSSSVSTGYESITGQINIEYKKPETNVPFSLNLFANHLGRFEANLTTSQMLNNKLGTLLLAHGSFLNSEIDHNNDSFLDMPKFQQLNLMNRWRYFDDFWESMTVFKVLYEDRKAGQKGYFNEQNSNLWGMEAKTQRYEFYTKNGFFLNEHLNQSIGTIVAFNHHRQNSFFGNNNYYAKQNSIFINALFETKLGEDSHEFIKNDEQNEEMIKGNNHKINIGLSYVFDEYDEKFNDSIYYRKETVPGVFGEYTFSGIENLSIIAGIRADFHNIWGMFLTPRFHARYEITEKTILRASAGKGYHIANIFSDNSGLMSSARKFIIDDILKPEIAWNYGVNISTEFSFFDIDWTLNLEYYRTDFDNQVIVDMEENPNEVHFYNLKGKSYSNSFQIDLLVEPIKDVKITTAYRYNDVRMTVNNELIRKPLISPHKAFLNVVVSLDEGNWKFDWTAEFNGGGRLPDTQLNPSEYRLPNEFPAFVLMYAQITKKIDNFEVYIGGENLTGFTQRNPILAYDKPFSKYFDGSMVWGPIDGTMFYIGARYIID